MAAFFLKNECRPTSIELVLNPSPKNKPRKDRHFEKSNSPEKWTLPLFIRIRDRTTGVKTEILVGLSALGI